MIDRRRFLQWAAAAAVLPRRMLEFPGHAAGASTGAALGDGAADAATRRGNFSPGRIPNEYSLLLPGEAEALARAPAVRGFGPDAVTASTAGGAANALKVGGAIDGWRLVALIPDLDGVPTAVFEKRASHRGAIVYVTERGEAARISTGVGDLANIRPRPVDATARREIPAYRVIPRSARHGPATSCCGSNEDPCYENVAALGEEFIGWTLVANEETGPERSLWLEADGKSREFGGDPQSLWAPDLTGRLFDPRRFLPSEYLYEYVPGYSKRTLFGGYLPAADIGVWNPHFNVGLRSDGGAAARAPTRRRWAACARCCPRRARRPHPGRATRTPSSRCPASRLGGPVLERERRSILRGAARAVDALAALLRRRDAAWRFPTLGCSTRPAPASCSRAAATAGSSPATRSAKGRTRRFPSAVTRSFPWRTTSSCGPSSCGTVRRRSNRTSSTTWTHYIEADGNFTYNTQDQVEAPLNVGVFLENSARAYDYGRDLFALWRRLPVLRRMVAFVAARHQYAVRTFPDDDPRHGLIWGSPEADLGDPKHDTPADHPFYYQNAAWVWRGLYEHGRVLAIAAAEAKARGIGGMAAEMNREGAGVRALASEMRAQIERSLTSTLAARNDAMKAAGITPFDPTDTQRTPAELSSYENHRFMMDWWTADWGDAALDAGHFRHRTMAGEQLLGMNTDGHYPRTSNFMEHGTLAGRIREDDYRPFLLALYGNLCYAMDSGSRYAPEDALLPGNFPGEGSPYAWSAVINSELQPTMALRWLLCWEEHDRRAACRPCICRRRRRSTGSPRGCASRWRNAPRGSARWDGPPSPLAPGGA